MIKYMCKYFQQQMNVTELCVSVYLYLCLLRLPDYAVPSMPLYIESTVLPIVYSTFRYKTYILSRTYFYHVRVRKYVIKVSIKGELT